MKRESKSKWSMAIAIISMGIMCGCGGKDIMTMLPEEEYTNESEEQSVQVEIAEDVMIETEDTEKEMTNEVPAETEAETVESEEQHSLTERSCWIAEAEETGLIELTESYFEKYNIIAVPVGMPCAVDLDGNGTMEEIVYEPQSSDGVNYEFLFYIRDPETEEYAGAIGDWSLAEMFWPSLDYYFVMDLDSADTYRELVFLDEGPSDDPEFHFLRYQDGVMTYLGGVYTDSPYNELVVNGDGKIIGSGRLYVLQTWNAPFTWELKDGRIRLAEEKWYYPYDGTEFGQEIKLIKQITVYKEPDLESESIKVEPSDGKVTFTCTDNENWVQFKREDEEGWIYLKDGYFMEADGEEVPTEKVFDGLIFAG